MAHNSPMWRRYLTLIRRDIRRDLKDEVEFHIEERARELIAGGLPEAAAQSEARRLFGDANPILAECEKIDRRFEKRRMTLGYLSDLTADVRYAFRQFRRQPKFWGVIVLTLVVGISASTAVFAIVDGVLLQPLPYRDPDRLVHVMDRAWKGIYYHLSERTETLDLGAYNGGPEVTLSTPDGPIRVSAATVSPDLFDTLGVAPALGRTFTPEESRPSSLSVSGSDTWRTYGVVVLSYGMWQSYFAGDPDTLGTSVTISGTPHTVIGIMPAGFEFPSRETTFWLPMSIEPSDNSTMWGANAWSIIGRLHSGISQDSARAEIHALIPTLSDQLPFYLELPEDAASGVPVRPLHDWIVGDVRGELLILLAAIGAVFLILCVNIANLLLARGLGRFRELSTRAMLGAGRGRLIRQLLVENIAVSIIAGFAGALVAYALVQSVVAFLPADLPRIDEIGVDFRVLGLALTLAVVAGLVFGLLPALRVTDTGTALSSRATRGIQAGPHEGRISNILVSLEFSLALALVVSAALMVQSLWNLSRVEPGFHADGLISARIAPPSAPDELNSDLLDRLRSAPGVTSVAIGTSIPFGNDGFTLGFGIERRVESNDNPTIADAGVAVTSDYHSTLGIPLIDGRTFANTDRSDSAPVVLVSESLARTYWGDTNPVGSRIRLPEQDPPWRTVIGIVGDAKWSDLSGSDPRVLYLPLPQHNGFTDLRRVVIRTDADPSVIAGSLRAIVGSLDPDTAVSDIRTSGSRIAESTARPRFIAYLLAGFAALALFLAGVGIYGVLTYAMNRRIPEIGVRLALGATNRDVFALLFRHGAKLTLIGVALGIPIAVIATRLLAGLLFGVEPADARILAIVIATILVIGLAVSYLPARRAGRIAPMIALRHD